MKPDIIKIAGVIIIDKKLLLEKSPHKSLLNCPGGKPFENETEENTLIRELYEELNIKVINFTKYLSFIDKLDNNPDKNIRIEYFLIKYYENIIKPSSEVASTILVDSNNYKTLEIGGITKNQLIPKLIQDKIII